MTTARQPASIHFCLGNASDVRSMEAVASLRACVLRLHQRPTAPASSEKTNQTANWGCCSPRAKLHGESFSFQPQFKLWFLVNQLPFVRDWVLRFWRRIKVIPFNRQFADDERDSNLPDKLWRSARGYWVVGRRSCCLSQSLS